MQYIYKINGTKAESINRGGTHGGDVNVIHHTGGIFQRGGQLKLFNQAKFSLQNIERVCIMCARDYTKSL